MKPLFTGILSTLAFLLLTVQISLAQGIAGQVTTLDINRNNGWDWNTEQQIQVFNHDTIGDVRFRGMTPSGVYKPAAMIRTYVNGTVGNASVPGNLMIMTGVPQNEMRMTVTAEGNVGVNTYTPRQLFTVSDLRPVIRLNGTSSDDFEVILDNGNYRWRGGADNFGNNLTNFMVLTNMGRLGIGTDAPEQILTVSDVSPVFRLDADAGGFDYEMFNQTGNLFFRGGADGTNGALTNRMVLTSLGRLGIGTDMPEQILTVSDASPVIRLDADAGGFDYEMFNQTGNLFFRGGANGTAATLTNRMVLTSEGKLGLGTDDPDELLTLSATNPVLRFDASGNDYEVYSQGGTLTFRGGADNNGSNLTDFMYLNNEGKLSIGTAAAPGDVGGVMIDDYRLFVAGGILTEELRVRTGWADYVFGKDYQLPTLDEVEQHIEEKGHLPNMPSAKEVEQGGLELGNIAVQQQEKIEELFLHVIRMNKELEALKTENANLKAELEQLKK